METKIVWLRNGRVFRQFEDKIKIIDKLPKKIYNMNFNPDTHEIFLEEFADEFEFNFKLYGLETKTINHIMKTFHNTKSNLGVLFNGVKGTGKTITAKIIANQMNLPVILINSPYPGLADFVSKINTDCILFFDEFEKNFSSQDKEDADILSIMDGVYNSPYRRVFLLTTNKLYINENLLGRPSRIRYKKSFGNLSTETILEYLDDVLINKDRVPEILEFVDTLEISTIDILKSIVEELNIHDCPLAEFKHFFNVESAKYSYMVQYKEYDDNEFTNTAELLPLFKADLAKIGTKQKDDDNKEYVVTSSHVDIYSRRINLSTNVEFLQIGTEIGYFGRVTEAMNDNGILICTTDYGETYVIKVMNLDAKPSLYRGGLVY